MQFLHCKTLNSIKRKVESIHKPDMHLITFIEKDVPWVKIKISSAFRSFNENFVKYLKYKWVFRIPLELLLRSDDTLTRLVSSAEIFKKAKPEQTTENSIPKLLSKLILRLLHFTLFWRKLTILRWFGNIILTGEITKSSQQYYWIGLVLSK